MITTDSADRLIEQLQLAPHPEGGWYRETWRAETDTNGRSKGTAILFLLKSGESSHWHRVDADELWIWQGGDPLQLRVTIDEKETIGTLCLGNDIASGQQLQGLVPVNAWQAAKVTRPPSNAQGYSLVTCVVVPGFDFAGFELAPRLWEPGGVRRHD